MTSSPPFHINVRPITTDDAAVIVQWRYPPPYEIYSFAGEDAKWLMRPELRYHVAWDEKRMLLGYYCYGEDARIPAAVGLGLYADENLMDVGLGMRPERTGKGLGLVFLSAGLEFGQRAFGAAGFRLTVAAWNERAVRLYRTAGFASIDSFEIPASGMEFLVMTRPTPRTALGRPPR